MPVYPRYHNPLDMVRFREGQLPFYILFNKRAQSILHHHDFAELLLVVEGKGHEIINGRRHTMQPGTVSVLLPHHIHEFHSDSEEPIVLYCCMFDYNILLSSPYDSELGRKLLETGKGLPSFYDLNDDQFQVFKGLMEEMYREYHGTSSGKDIMIKSKLLEAFLLLMRYYEDKGGRKDEEMRSRNLRSIWNIIHYVHLHSSQPQSLQGLSQYFQLSPTHISRSFRKYVGTSFLEYLHALRINRAATLLSTTDMTVFEISIEVGFEHFRSFSRRFKQMIGQTPQQFRKNTRSG